MQINITMSEQEFLAFLDYKKDKEYLHKEYVRIVKERSKHLADTSYASYETFMGVVSDIENIRKKEGLADAKGNS